MQTYQTEDGRTLNQADNGSEKMSCNINMLQSRGCEYLFDFYEDNTAVVTCINKHNKVIWDCCGTWADGETVNDLIKTAKSNLEWK